VPARRPAIPVLAAFSAVSNQSAYSIPETTGMLMNATA
jgi:hypothetical protein